MPDDLTPDDQTRLNAISNARGRACAGRIYDYYHDVDRANRTPRAVMYLHLGMLTGIIYLITDEK